MAKIWIVEGSCGEYSDQQQWPVKAFRDEVRAQRLVVEAQARANEISTLKTETDWEEWYDANQRKEPKTQNEFDPEMASAYGDTRYYCYEIELDETGGQR